MYTHTHTHTHTHIHVHTLPYSHTGKGMGLKQHKQDVVEDDTNPTHSTSSNDFDADVEGDNDESGRDTQESPETVVRACFAFTGEGDDEVRNLSNWFYQISLL